LGARTINQSIIAHLPELLNSDIQVIWQTGKNYFADCEAALNKAQDTTAICCTAFISQMPMAYALADLVISRAGASSISELCLLGKPSILVPSPNVAEDHQTHNAMALVRKDAAVLVKDMDAQKDLISSALSLIQDDNQLDILHKNILTLALPDSARLIAAEVMKLAKK
jgi:UDP-N-acetylglucosamine--N-acetylmuramyl-(pentapeptide) pyrophosphoryl-undecaprenol N-acetylglucosamine transferase